MGVPPSVADIPSPRCVGVGGGVHKVLMSLHLNSSCVYSKDLAPIVVLDIINN